MTSFDRKRNCQLNTLDKISLVWLVVLKLFIRTYGLYIQLFPSWIQPPFHFPTRTSAVSDTSKEVESENERVSEKEAAHFPSAVAALKGNLKGMTTTEVFFVLLLGFSKCFFYFLRGFQKTTNPFPPPKKKYIYNMPLICDFCYLPLNDVIWIGPDCGFSKLFENSG